MKLASTLAIVLAAPLAAQHASPVLRAVPLEQIEITDAFWKPRLELYSRVTVKACFDQLEAHGALANFERAAKGERGGQRGGAESDADVYRTLEAAAFALHYVPDPQLAARVDAWIDVIAAAQRADGYLNTLSQLDDPTARWRDLRAGRELACTGYLIEAGLAQQRMTGKSKLLEVALRSVNLIGDSFGVDGRAEIDPTAELELALAKLARETGEERYAKLALVFLDRRGRARPGARYGELAQDHAAVREQRSLAGDLTSAMNLCAAMTLLVAHEGGASLSSTLELLWKDAVDHRMDVAGGLAGPGAEPFEGELCATLGFACWNQELLLLTGDAKYADIVERSLHNAILAGVSLTGDRFLASSVRPPGAQLRRVAWPARACCATNLTRFLVQLGDLVLAEGDDELRIAQHMACSVEATLGGQRATVSLGAGDGWRQSVRATVRVTEPARFSVRVRGVRACRATHVSRRPASGNGFAQWNCTGPLQLTLAPHDARWSQVGTRWATGASAVDFLWLPGFQRLYSAPDASAARVAVQYGRFVYCVESLDNFGSSDGLRLTEDAELRVRASADLPEEVQLLRAGNQVPFSDCAGKRAERLELVPWFAVANRSEAASRVWLDLRPPSLERAGTRDIEHAGVWISSSARLELESVNTLNDGVWPVNSDDGDTSRCDVPDAAPGGEWLQYEFPCRTVERASVYWHDTHPLFCGGRYRVPASWRLTYLAADGWTPVVLRNGSSYGCALDGPQTVEFEPLRTDALRLEIQPQPGCAVGLYEWDLGEAQQK